MLDKSKRQNPKYYDGTRKTSYSVKELLPKVLRSIGGRLKERPELVIALWPQVVGPRLAQMTRAVFFSEGILEVKVSNSTLLSLLVQSEKKRILSALRKRLPETQIRDIKFRIG